MLYIEVDTHGLVPIYAQVMDQIRRRIHEGKLILGAALPSVRQLAADLDINPNTVAKAYGLLERDGILETARRRGTQVATTAPERVTRALENRIEVVIDRVLEEIAPLGLDARELMRGLAARVEGRAPDEERSERRSS